MNAKAISGLNTHVDFDECPCAGPYQLTGLRGENFGIVWGESESEVVAKAQERNANVYRAIALDSADLK